MTSFFARLHGVILKRAAILSHPENGSCIWVAAACLGDKLLRFASLTKFARCFRKLLNASFCWPQKDLCSIAEAACGRDNMVAALGSLLCGPEKTALFWCLNRVDLSKAENKAVYLLASLLSLLTSGQDKIASGLLPCSLEIHGLPSFHNMRS